MVSRSFTVLIDDREVSFRNYQVPGANIDVKVDR